MWPTRDVLLFFKVIHLISRSHNMKNQWSESNLSKISRPVAAFKSPRFALLIDEQLMTSERTYNLLYSYWRNWHFRISILQALWSRYQRSRCKFVFGLTLKLHLFLVLMPQDAVATAWHGMWMMHLAARPMPLSGHWPWMTEHTCACSPKDTFLKMKKFVMTMGTSHATYLGER